MEAVDTAATWDPHDTVRFGDHSLASGVDRYFEPLVASQALERRVLLHLPGLLRSRRRQAGIPFPGFIFQFDVFGLRFEQPSEKSREWH